jgi:peptide-methionine (S)-S-oxide reductase
MKIGISSYLLVEIMCIVFVSCLWQKEEKYNYTPAPNLSIAYFAEGCFWCAESIFESVEGVDEVVSGYCGGEASGANYNAVSEGYTKHAESIAVYYNSSKINYDTLLKIFFASHDPTTLNRQGPDKGRQYRSAIFFQSESERLAASAFIEKLYTKGTFPQLSVTTILEPYQNFYRAEDYHQNFERSNPHHEYIQAVSVPRVLAFKNKFPHLLKKKYAH